MTFPKARIQFPCPKQFLTELKMIDEKELEIPQSLQDDIINHLQQLRRPKPEVNAITEYASAHKQKVFVMLNKFHVRWWGGSPEHYHEHLYFCTLIQGAPENVNGVWYGSVGFSPWSGKLHIPENGYTLEQTFTIFLNKGSDFCWNDIDKLKYDNLDSAIMQYACMASRNPELKLLVNTKKGVQFLIGNTGGCPVFSSFSDMNKFFYGDDSPDDGESLNNLLEMMREKLYARMSTLPNGSIFK